MQEEKCCIQNVAPTGPAANQNMSSFNVGSVKEIQIGCYRLQHFALIAVLYTKQDCWYLPREKEETKEWQ